MSKSKRGSTHTNMQNRSKPTIDLSNLIEKKKLQQRVRKLKELFDTGKVPTLAVHEVYPQLPADDRINYIYFTLPISLNFQRSSPAMWRSAFNTFNDPETNYLFYPELLVQESREKVQTDLTKHKLALQRNKHTDIWIKISQTFNEKYESDPRAFLAQHNFDVAQILEALQKTEKKSFPYLSGNKMANYWLFILNEFTDVKLINLDKISIIPDTHVIQCSIELGLADKSAKPAEIAALWFDLLEGTEILPIEMHPVLWNWSRANFEPKV